MQWLYLWAMFCSLQSIIVKQIGKEINFVFYKQSNLNNHDNGNSSVKLFMLCFKNQLIFSGNHIIYIH